MLAAIVSKIQERSPLKYSFARNLVSLDPRLIAAEPDKVVRMFREVLTKLVDKKWRTPEQADDIWMQYKKLVTEVKQFHKDKFSGFKFGEDRLDTFFFEVLDQKIAYKGLWCTVQLSSYFVSWSSCSRVRVFSQQRYSCTKSRNTKPDIYMPHS